MYTATITRKNAHGKTSKFRITGTNLSDVTSRATLAARRAVRINGGTASVEVTGLVNPTVISQWDAGTGKVRKIRRYEVKTFLTFEVSRRAAPTVSRDERLYLKGLAARQGLVNRHGLLSDQIKRYDRQGYVIR